MSCSSVTTRPPLRWRPARRRSAAVAPAAVSKRSERVVGRRSRADEAVVGVERAEAAHARDGLVDDVGPLAALGGRHPREGDAPGLDAQEREQLAEHAEAPPGVVVAGGVVAVGRMAAADDHAVGAALEGLDDEQRVDAAGAGQADDAHVARHVQAAGAGQVGAGVGAPVAHEGGDARLEALGAARSVTHVTPSQGVDLGVDLLVGEVWPARRSCDGQTATQVPQPWQTPGLT